MGVDVRRKPNFLVGATVPNTPSVDGDATSKIYVDTLPALLNAITQNAIQGAQISAHLQANAGYYVMSGDDVTVTGSAAGASAARLSMAAGRIYRSITELNISAQSNQAALATAQNTTVASGSNGIVVGTFAGSSTLNVASTTGFASSGVLFIGDVSAPTTCAIVTYTGTTGTTFTGCTFINSGQSASFTMATSDTVYGANCDTVYGRWGVIEVNTSGTYTLNLGTAASLPTIPSLNSTRVPHYLLYIPPNTHTIDALPDTVNGNAKLIDIREIVTARTARVFGSDMSSPSVSNPNAALTLLGSQYTIPANSLAVGDVFKVSASLIYTNSTNNTTLELWLGIVSTTALALDWTTDTLNSSANSRRIDLELTFQVDAIGASAGFLTSGLVSISTAQATVTFPRYTTGTVAAPGGVEGQSTISAIGHAGTFVSTSDALLALYVKIGASSTCTVSVRNFVITKIPA